MNIEKFEDLEIWQEARTLSKIKVQLTENRSFKSDFKLKDQIIRGSCGSMMDNIVEGFGRNVKGEFIQFVSIAKGSSGETRSQSYRTFDFKHDPRRVK